MKVKTEPFPKLLVLALIVICTIVVGYLALNAYNRELFSSGLLPMDLQQKLNNSLSCAKNKKSDTEVLSSRILKTTYEIGNPHIIDSNKPAPDYCYQN